MRSRSIVSGARAASAALLGIALLLPLAACGEKPAGKSPAASASPSSAKAAPAKASKRGGGRGSKGDSTAALGLRVKLELLQKLGIDGLRVEVETEAGNVVLAGEVKKRATSELASEVAGQVSGVTKVDNRIQVADTGGGGQVDKALAEAEHELADAALETRARLALVDRFGSDGFRIGTEAASGVVTLSFPKGLKPKRRKQAVNVVKDVEGVVKVVSLDKP